MAYLGIPQNTIAVLQKYHFNFQKKFGQNFLIDTTVLDRIISSAEITKEDCVLEIGPGIGTMTQYLAERAGSVVAVEIDKALLPILEETLQDYDNVTVINDDILKVDINRLVEEKKMFSLIRASFNQRRKTLVNGLGNAGLPGITKESASAALEQMGLSPTVRGEALTLEQFAQLSDLI